MKIKNIMLTLVASSALYAFGSQTYKANASAWHNGVPEKFVGKWTSKLTYLKGRNDYETNYVTVSKNMIDCSIIGAPNPTTTKKLKYKYDGNNTYTINGTPYGQGTYWNYTDHYKVHFYNNSKIYISHKDKYDKRDIFYMAHTLTRTNKERQYKLNN